MGQKKIIFVLIATYKRAANMLYIYTRSKIFLYHK